MQQFALNLLDARTYFSGPTYFTILPPNECKQKITWKMDDPRFSKLFTDPKYRNVPKKERKVKIDDRFQALFKDKRFVSKVSVDKRGRPGDFSTKENYEKFYRMDTSDEDDDSSDDGGKKAKVKKPKEVAKAIKDPNVDYARGEAFLSDSSSGEEDSSDDETSEKKEEEETEFDKWGELDHDAETTEEATRRLAVCNMDWDRVTAQDLFLVLSSFCPPGGRLLKVSIYPSEFGKKRIAEEDALGPQELRSKRDDSDDDSEDDEGDRDDTKDMERVRKYQINRLKYYYAVAEFNSPITANRVYTQCDGNEYELSATKFDLRFIPDDMEFKDDPPKEMCSKAPDPEVYKPKFFSTSALALGKVDLTWDETDPERLQAMQKAFEGDDIDEKALKAYLASSSEDEGEGDSKAAGEADVSEEEDEEAVIAKYRALLGGVSEEKKFGNDDDDDDEDDGTGMEMTFVPEADKKKAALEKSVDSMTPWEKYLHKKKEKRKEKRGGKRQANNSDDDDDDDVPSDVDLNDPFFKQDLADEKPSKKSKKKKKNPKKSESSAEENKDLSLLVMDSDDDKDHFDYKQIVKEQSKSKKSKKKAKKAGITAAGDDFKMDFDDPRFAAVFENPNFNVDPSHPSFKKTKSMQEVIEEKQKRIVRTKPTSSLDSPPSSKKMKAEAAAKTSLDSLVNSVKAKSKRSNFSRPRKH